jgi:hypothetical protein
MMIDAVEPMGRIKPVVATVEQSGAVPAEESKLSSLLSQQQFPVALLV